LAAPAPPSGEAGPKEVRRQADKSTPRAGHPDGRLIRMDSGPSQQARRESDAPTRTA
jgi:hypothetical protein